MIKIDLGNDIDIKAEKLNQNMNEESKAVVLLKHEGAIGLDEIEWEMDDADIDDERYSGKNINDSFINKLKDFSAFNPSGNKGKEKTNNSMMVVPMSVINMKK
jgi:hypothetical protein